VWTFVTSIRTVNQVPTNDIPRTPTHTVTPVPINDTPHTSTHTVNQVPTNDIPCTPTHAVTPVPITETSYNSTPTTDNPCTPTQQRTEFAYDEDKFEVCNADIILLVCYVTVYVVSNVYASSIGSYVDVLRIYSNS